MFTGIITHVGKIKEKTKSSLLIEADTQLLSQLRDGMSISVNGICLTVIHVYNKTFKIDFMPETESKTNLSFLVKESPINLELPATPESFLAGHIVQGHVDGIASIKSIELDGNSNLITLVGKKGLGKYIVEKGSITLNGISLTVISVQSDEFTVGIIPHTWEHTMLHSVKVGDVLNVEVDVLAKYIEKLIKKIN